MNRYAGGKNAPGVYQTLINQIPPHRRYFEVFAGSGAVFRNKRLAEESFLVDLDPQAVENLSSSLAEYGDSVKTICDDAIYFIFHMNNKSREPFCETDFIYADPPYVMTSRKQKSALYTYEMDDNTHKNLLTQLKRTPAMVMISGYYSEMYMDFLKDWRLITFTVMTRGGTPAIEHVWMNYDEPKLLHDSKWYGQNARERDKYNKRRKRLRAKLEKMDFIERQILIETVNQWADENLPTVGSVASSGDTAPEM